MRYKNVFYIWLWADLMLLGGGFVFALVYMMMEGLDALMLYAYAGLLLIGFSIPSLLILLSFHAMKSTKGIIAEGYMIPYCTVILSINVLYAIVSRYAYHIDTGTLFLYILSFAAGFLALCRVDHLIRKNNKVLIDSLSIDDRGLPPAAL